TPASSIPPLYRTVPVRPTRELAPSWLWRLQQFHALESLVPSWLPLFFRRHSFSAGRVTAKPHSRCRPRMRPAALTNTGVVLGVRKTWVRRGREYGTPLGGLPSPSLH